MEARRIGRRQMAGSDVGMLMDPSRGILPPRITPITSRRPHSSHGAPAGPASGAATPLGSCVAAASSAAPGSPACRASPRAAGRPLPPPTPAGAAVAITASVGSGKSHQQRHRQALRELAQSVRVKQDADAAPPSPAFKMKRFSHVPSKISSRRPSAGSSPAASACGTRPSSADGRMLSSADLEALLQAGSLDGDGAVDAPPPPKDFVRLNRQRAIAATPKEPPPPPVVGTPRTTRLGEVPAYLVHRKLEWVQQEQDRLARLRAAKIPPGHRCLTPAECATALRRLQAETETIQGQLRAFPVYVETPRMRARVDALEERLREIDRTMERYRRPIVYAPIAVVGAAPAPEYADDAAAPPTASPEVAALTAELAGLHVAATEAENRAISQEAYETWQSGRPNLLAHAA
ncbi:hypothetical protein CXG81DRAFT_23071 [Caulochytrium protostelioides]|uniref:Enkurin domain-containing protein n=1 Tax=Caulochytrium protostelioides TaxID=1555241 RepID=A0A4P9XFD2_9FUNG|nr:hypothetical protein CXG81DRAFT_23071 [Caulochytrium protostelioides]|eukprot:RKP04295.1 hypothetical protein CXG81DRAFT_23071 [Caulochytrium protostelioides]